MQSFLRRENEEITHVLSMKVAKDGNTQMHRQDAQTSIHPLGMFWQRTEESTLTIATLLACCLHRENTLSVAHCFRPSLTVSRRSSHCLIILCTDLLWTCAQLCHVSIGLRVDFRCRIKERKRKIIIAPSDERDRVERRVGVSRVPPFSSFLTCSITFFLLSCLGEKRGVPFHAEQGVVQKGPSGAFSSRYSHLFLFSLFFPLLFVSLIGLTDHSFLTYSPEGMLGSLGINTVAM